MSFDIKIKHLCLNTSKYVKPVDVFTNVLGWHRLGSKNLSVEYLNCVGYTDGSVFSIVKVEKDAHWSVAHIPSENIILSGIKRKKDAESILEKFKDLSGDEYDDIWNYTPDLSTVSIEFWERLTASLMHYHYTKSHHYKLGSSR